jgi:hypothetical protein
MVFCDFCPCEQCKTGEVVIEVFHAQTVDGRWICDICWHYSACLSAPDRLPNGPCEDLECHHRPKLAGPWTKKEAT